MRNIIYLILISILLGCSSSHNKYSIKGNLSTYFKNNDTMVLYIFDKDYQGLREVNISPVNNHQFIFQGDYFIENQVGLIKALNDSNAYLVYIDIIPTEINVRSNSYEISKGSMRNINLSESDNKLRNLIQERKSINLNYLKLIKDTLLTDTNEVRILNRYNELGDSALNLSQELYKLNEPIKKIRN